MKKSVMALIAAGLLVMPLTGQAGFNLGKVLDKVGVTAPSAPAEENRGTAQGPAADPITQSSEEEMGGGVHYSGG